MKGIQIFKILGVLITLLVCISGSYATNPEAVNATDNVNYQQTYQTNTDLGNIADDSGVDDSYTVYPVYEPLNGVYRTLTLEKFVADDLTTDDSNADDSGSDDTNPTDIYYTLATSELTDGNVPLAAGSDETEDSGVDDSDSGSGEVDDNEYDETGIDDGSSDDNGTDEYILTEQDPLDDSNSSDDDGVSYVYYKNGSGYATSSGTVISSNNSTLNKTNSIPMQHTGAPILPTVLGVLSLMGGFVINKRRS